MTQHDHSSSGTTRPTGSSETSETTSPPTRRSLQAASATPPVNAGTPVPSAEELSVVVTGLDHPRGFTWGPDGALYVALAGDGLTPLADGSLTSPPRPDAPPSVVRVENGEVTPVVQGLPSTQDPYGDVMGPVDVGFLGETLYILQDAAAEELDDVALGFPNGLYAIERSDDTRLVSSVTVFVGVNPAENKYHFVPLGEPFAMVPDEREEGFWVVDANQGLVLHVLPEGTITKIADISLDHPVPTAIAPTPDGGVFVGFLGNGVHADGTSKIIKVMPSGDVYDFWTGLTAVTGIVMAPDGTLYALELSTGNDNGIRPHTGRVVRQTGPDSLEEVVTGLNYPISMKMGPDGALYISLPAITTDGEKGSIIRVDPVLGEPIAIPTGYPNQAAAGEGGVVR